MTLYRTALLVLLSNFVVHAQVQDARVVGTILDPNKSVVPAAIVTLTETSTNITRRVKTGASGDFIFTPLNPGVYTLSATASGFETTVRNRIDLLAAQTLRIDLELRIGATSTQVDVTAEVPLLDSDSGTVSQSFESRQIVDLPLNGRELHELGQLTPAALLGATGNVQLVRPEYVNGTTIGGVRGAAVSFMIDGVDVTEQHQGGTWVSPSVDSLQEFSVQQNGYSSEYKRAGASFNGTTKNGTNHVHGNLFEFLRNTVFDSRNFFAKTRPVLKRNQFGGTVGGPVVVPHLYDGRGKMFFFASYQGMRYQQEQNNNSNVPNLNNRQGIFTSAIYDPLTTVPSGSSAVRTLFPNRTIPASRMSHAALFFEQYVPLPNSGTGTNLYTAVQPLRREQLTLRTDRQIGSNHRIFVRWSYADNRQGAPSPFETLGTATLSGLSHNVAVVSTNNLRTNLIHEFRYNYLVGNYRSSAYMQGTNFNKLAGITGLEDTQIDSIATLPQFAISGFTSFNGQGGDGRPKFQNRLVNEFTDTVTWIKGRHVMKFGADIRYFKILFTDTRTFVGSWNFTGVNTQNPASPSGTGNAWADFLLGLPYSGARSFPATWWGGYGTYWHGFIQDDVKVTSRLTMNLGFRYEYSPWLNGYRNLVATFDGTSAKPIIVASNDGTIDLAAQPGAASGFGLLKNMIQTSNAVGLPSTITYPDTRQLGPRLGFAWRPFGNRTVIRGGVGMFYEPEGTSGRLNFNFLPWNLGETVFATPGVIPNRTLENFFLGAPIGSASTNPTWSPTPTHLRMGYDEHFSFGVQHQVFSKLMMEVNYVGNRGRFLSSTNTVNDPFAGPGNIQTRRPYPFFGAITFNTQDSSSQFDSLQIKAERRFAGGFWFLASFTYAGNFSWQNTPAVGGNTAWQKARNAYDVPKSFNSSYGYDLPVGRGKRFLGSTNRFTDAVLGGWKVTTILIFRSHTPFTPTISTDVANTGEANQVPVRVVGCSGRLDEPTLAKWFDKSCFKVPAPFTYGNAGGSILRGDYYGQSDVALSKQFRILERYTLQVRAEAFNLPNAAYFGNPNTNIDTTAGATVTSTYNTARQVQFSLKLNF